MQADLPQEASAWILKGSPVGGNDSIHDGQRVDPHKPCEDTDFVEVDTLHISSDTARSLDTSCVDERFAHEGTLTVSLNNIEDRTTCNKVSTNAGKMIHKEGVVSETEKDSDLITRNHRASSESFAGHMESQVDVSQAFATVQTSDKAMLTVTAGGGWTDRVLEQRPEVSLPVLTADPSDQLPTTQAVSAPVFSSHPHWAPSNLPPPSTPIFYICKEKPLPQDLDVSYIMEVVNLLSVG